MTGWMRERIPWLGLASIGFVLLAAVSGSADEPPGSSTTNARPTDFGDVWRHVRHRDDPDATPDDGSEKRFLLIAPSLTSKPSTGVMGGVAGTLAFVHGDPLTTHMSTATVNAKVSTKGQVTSSLRFGAFSSEDRWFMQGDNRFQWTSLNVYGTGLTSPITKESLKYNWFRIYETAYHRISSRPLFAGGGLNVNDHTNVRLGQSGIEQSEYAAYSKEYHFQSNRQVSSGTNLGLFFDTRDNAINPQQGWLASATYRTFFNGFIGGDATWQELNLDVRTYRKLTKDARRKLAFWFLGDLVTGGRAPYLDLPATSGDTYGRSARGYAEGRYRGPHMLYSEVEYRGPLALHGLLGMVAFANATTLDGDAPGQELFRSFAPGGGLGLRVLLNKRSRTNLCADYGVGRQGSRGFYLAVQEAF